MRTISFGDILDMQLPAEVPPGADLHEHRKDLFCIYILEDVIDQIHKQAETDNPVEGGGVLIGHPFVHINQSEKKFVVVTGCIETHSKNRSRSHFTVMPEELIRVRDEVEHSFPGQVVVGWYHSHPGLGVFLSSQDMQIVRSIYSADWHVAYVVDPIRNQQGFFYSQKGIQTDEVHTLRKQPACIEAISRYNLALASQETGDSSELERFKIWLLADNSEELAHWRTKKEYQDLSLGATPQPDLQINTAIDEDREALTKGNKSKIEKLVQQAQHYVKNGPAYMVLPQIEQIFSLCLDKETSTKLSKILQDLNKRF